MMIKWPGHTNRWNSTHSQPEYPANDWRFWQPLSSKLRIKFRKTKGIKLGFPQKLNATCFFFVGHAKKTVIKNGVLECRVYIRSISVFVVTCWKALVHFPRSWHRELDASTTIDRWFDSRLDCTLLGFAHTNTSAGARTQSRFLQHTFLRKSDENKEEMAKSQGVWNLTEWLSGSSPQAQEESSLFEISLMPLLSPSRVSLCVSTAGASWSRCLTIDFIPCCAPKLRPHHPSKLPTSLYRCPARVHNKKKTNRKRHTKPFFFLLGKINNV